MSIKLIASDMDGTLLDHQSHLSQENIDVIRKLSEKNVEFLICSGRDFEDAKTIMAPSGIACSYICLSGAAVYDEHGTMMTRIPLTPENVESSAGILDKYHISMDIMASHGRYSTFPREEKFLQVCGFLNGRKKEPGPISEEVKQAARERLSSVTFIKSIKEIPEDVTIFKICCDGLEEETVVKLKEEFKAYPDLAAASSFPTNIELTNSQAQKGNALKAYAEMKGISLEDVMVLGDSDNDLSMFTPEFGWTVAMANAMPCIRDAAKYHTKSNVENGVAYAIETYVLSRNGDL